MMFIFPFLSFCLLGWLTLFNWRKDKGLRQTFLETFLLISAFVAATTEILSIFRLITRLNLILLWFGVNFILLGWLYWSRKIELWKSLAEVRQRIRSAPKMYLIFAGFIYAVTLIISLSFPPNTYDSMTYHLARVANWIQFGSVEFYPTAILRQLYQAPLAEFTILHLQLLSGGDFFANLPQWFAFIACGAAVSLIAKEFGENLKIQFFSLILSATIPMAIVQASGTQNDLIVSVFILSFFYFWLRAVKSEDWADFIWVGLSLGLALLAKGTTYFYCFPIGLIFSCVYFAGLKKNPQRWLFIKQLFVVLLVAAAFNFGHYARNYKLFSSPVSTGEEKMAITEPNAKMLFSNVARNYLVHLGTTSNGFNKWVETRLAEIFGDELNNPNSTWLDNKFAVFFSTHEDSAGNFFHLILITLALIMVFLARGEDKKYLLCLAFSIFVGFILYSVMLRWQMWASRLHTPLFMLGSVLVAVCVARLFPKIAVVITTICVLLSLPFLFQSNQRQILANDGKIVWMEQTRQQSYFKNLPSIEQSCIEAVGFIHQQPQPTESIGLLFDYNDYEYPYWLFLKNDFRQKPNIYHVGIKNVSANLVGERPLPELIISTRHENTIEGVEYEKIWEKSSVKVLRKK